MSSPVRQRRPWDTILTIILLILFVGVVIVCSFAGALVVFAGDSCGASAECNYDIIGAAVMVGLIGPAVVGVVVLVVTIVRLVRKRVAFFVPLIGSVLAAAVVAGAFALASSAVVPTV